MRRIENNQDREQARTPADSSAPSLRRQAAVAGVVVALVLALLGGMALLGASIQVPFRVFTKEVAEQFQARGYVGFLAHITWFLWVVAGTAGMLAAALLWQRDRRDRRIGFFLGTSLLTAWLLFDDFVMFHEWFPIENALYAMYAVILALLLLRFRAQFVRSGALLAVMAGAFWAASIFFDVLQERWQIHAYVLEDGSKMIGTALWTAFMVWSCLRAVGMESRKPGGDRMVGEQLPFAELAEADPHRTATRSGT